MTDGLKWSGQVDVTDPELGIPVQLHVQGRFAGDLPSDRQPWIESTLRQLLPHAVTQAGKVLLPPDATGIALALHDQCRAILSRRGIEGEVVVEHAWVTTESRERLEAAQRARATGAQPEDDVWESTMLSAKSDLLDAAQASSGPASQVAVECAVLWSDGQRYPGRILERKGGQALVEMRDGQSHWIAASYVEES